MGFLIPKRPHTKRLDFVLLGVRDQGVGGLNPLSPWEEGTHEKNRQHARCEQDHLKE
jgi:hypothetical protein